MSYFFFLWFESLFPWSGPMYMIFGKMMSDKRVYILFLLNTWFVVAIEMIFNRWYVWRVLKMYSAKI